MRGVEERERKGPFSHTHVSACLLTTIVGFQVASSVGPQRDDDFRRKCYFWLWLCLSEYTCVDFLLFLALFSKKMVVAVRGYDSTTTVAVAQRESVRMWFFGD